MIIVGDIGNSETKICLVNNKKKIIKKITLNTKKINLSLLKKSLAISSFDPKLINKCLFCSVVPKKFNKIKNFFKKEYKIKCFELKKLDLKKLIKIKVNYKQVGSDRLANAIGVINGKSNFVILKLVLQLPQQKNPILKVFVRLLRFSFYNFDPIV